tara:strand:- start:3110 stop:3766 length:657 start_codon:yes stop_codon:yes gene_type:complete
MNKIIIICVPGNTFSGKFIQNLTYLVRHLNGKGFKTYLCNTYSRNIYEVRNKCLFGRPEKGSNQKPFNGIDYDYILWIDDDITFTPDDFQKLYKEDKDVISALYLMANNTQFAVVEVWDEAFFHEHGSFEFLGREEVSRRILPFKVEYVGFGFILFKHGVFEQLEYPWFEPTYLQIKEAKDFSMEDVTLCLKLKDNNVDVYVHPNVIVGHEKTIELRL